jgi:hypothetical protein
MNQQLPPWALIKAWLNIIQQEDVPLPIRQKRIVITQSCLKLRKIINYIFFFTDSFKRTWLVYLLSNSSDMDYPLSTPSGCILSCIKYGS